MKVIFAAIPFLAASNSFAVSDEAEKAFAEKYPGIEVEDWEVDRNGFWEAKFQKNGKEYRADFTEEGLWIETETNVDYDDLPDKVKRKIKIEFGDDEISEIEEVDHSSKGRIFDVEFKRPGENQDIEYDVYGNRKTPDVASMMQGLQTPVGPFTNQQSAEELRKSSCSSDPVTDHG